MKVVDKYYASGKGASQQFLNMPINHHNLVSNIYFLNFPDFS